MLLAGGGATDDPEGAVVLQEVKEAAGSDPDIIILDLPPWCVAEIERFVSSPATRPRMFLKKFVNYFYHLSSQAFNGSRVPHINTGQLLGQNRFVSGEQTPMRKIIGEALADKVMFLEGPEGVLKDRIIRTLAQGLQ